MIIQASCGAGGGYDCMHRKPPENRVEPADGESQSRELVPVRNSQSTPPPSLTSHRPAAPFLAQLAEQYSSRSDRADARRKRLDTALASYDKTSRRPAARGTERDVRA